MSNRNTPFEETLAGKTVMHLQTLQADAKLTAGQLKDAIGYKGASKGLNEAMRRCDLLACEHRPREGYPGGSLEGHWFLADGVEVLPPRRQAPDIKPRPGMLLPGVYATGTSA